MAENFGFESRKLLRAARSAVLATTADGGQPFASLITLACTPDFFILLLLSDLSEHTRHLRAEPRCSVFVQGLPDGPNPQTAPRVTVTGMAEMVENSALKARYLAIHPYAAMYADFGDFHLWRIRAMSALFVGGFARAVRVRQADLLPDATAAAAVSGAEPAIIDHCNNDHPDALTAIAGGVCQMVAADTDGMDLAAGEQIWRFHWSAPVSDAGGVRTELLRMTKEAQTGASG